MAYVYRWRIALRDPKAKITTDAVDDADASLFDIMPYGMGIFCNADIYKNKDLAKNIGQAAIDVLRNAVIDNSNFYVNALPYGKTFYYSTKLNRPKDDVFFEKFSGTGNDKFLLTVDPDYELGFIICNPTIDTTGLLFTAFQRIRDYILETNSTLPLFYEAEDFTTQDANGWNCTRPNEAISVAVDYSTTEIVPINTARFYGDRGLLVESNRFNQVPDTVTYATWTVDEGNTFSLPITDVCVNQATALLTCVVDVVPKFHRMYKSAGTGVNEFTTFFLRIDPRKTLAEFRHRAIFINLNSDGTSNRPDIASSVPFGNGWRFWTIDTSSGTAEAFLSISLLSDTGAQTWIADQAYTLEFFGMTAFITPYPLTYAPIQNIVGEVYSKPPFPLFDGNDFELTVNFSPEFTSAQGVPAGGQMVVFEIGVQFGEQIKIYYNLATRQMVFDRYAQGQPAFAIIPNGVLTFDQFENLAITIRQTPLDGMSIEVKGFVGLNTSANAKLHCNGLAGNMFLGCDVSGSGKGIGAFSALDFKTPAPII